MSETSRPTSSSSAPAVAEPPRRAWRRRAFSCSDRVSSAWIAVDGGDELAPGTSSGWLSGAFAAGTVGAPPTGDIGEGRRVREARWVPWRCAGEAVEELVFGNGGRRCRPYTCHRRCKEGWRP
ncbi:hypothetical protein PR202_gb00813 [Eleusine coracana subsp. coracana]|uniref:Uncharacterized protein n=1 Tax=Eleusine coracana subsp. coracana TaxID=191504 RepID=A0AAV5DSU1_ELECO|nr:hypothetical protein PR202_gb00813 [Eleusine coracana subsp. coracana]